MVLHVIISHQRKPLVHILSHFPKRELNQPAFAPLCYNNCLKRDKQVVSRKGVWSLTSHE